MMILWKTMECPASMGATAECSDPTLTPLNAYNKILILNTVYQNIRIIFTVYQMNNTVYLNTVLYQNI